MKKKKLNKIHLRKRIMQLVEEMGRTNPFGDYCMARSDFYLLPKIKSIYLFHFATARDAWEYAGLTRDDLVRAFYDVRGREPNNNADQEENK